MKYKLLVLDIDGTLTNSHKKITLFTKKTLYKLQKNGVKIALASGRPTYGIMPVAKELELDQFGGYIISFNGGRIVDCSNGKVLYEKTMPVHMIHKLYKLSKENKVPIVTYQDQYLITEDPDHIYVKHESAINQMEIKKVNSFPDYVDFPVTKCLMAEEGEYLAKVESKVKAAIGDELSIYRSEPFFLEIMPRNIDKSISLRALSKYRNISNEEMVACGDGFNDRSMIQYAGLGVAMENAQDIVKQAADYIAPTNDEDGVAFVVNQFMLNSKLARV